MHEVQKVQLGDLVSTHAAGGSRPEGILEDPDGVTRLYFDGREVGRLGHHRVDVVRGLYKNNTVSIEWRRWLIDELLLTPVTAILFLNGATMQELVLPYVLLRARASAPYDSIPRLYEVALAEILSAPEELSRFDLLALLLPEAREG